VQDIPGTFFETILNAPAAQQPHDVKEYPNAGHSFLEQFPVGPLAPVLRVAGLGYEAASADDAWRRIRAFFEEHLAAGESRGAG
jgi:dienelactone hydrolase